MTESDPSAEWALLAPSEETLEFVGSARAQFSSLFPTSVIRTIAEGGPAPMEHWTDLVDQGYLAVGMPEQSGGIGTLADLVTVLEEAGHALLPLPLLASAASAHTLLRAGFDADSLDDAPSALAVSTDPSDVLIALDAAHAATVTVVSATLGGVVIERIAATAQPAAPRDPIDPTRPLVTLERGAVLDRRALSDVTVDDVLAAARVCVAADLLGTATLALEGATEHAKRREQFGRPIGSFQSVKHQIVDGYISIERARSLTLGAAAELVTHPFSATGTELSLLAKAAASDAATGAVALHTQLLGAMGLTYESDNHLAVRRAQQTAGYLGTASDLYARTAALILDRSARG
ncbi:acyl-CoA dehydrogenase family protein [Microbacterium sp. Root61]|uniref:acyl-CoA dehydrogenase family protein n=1 Tax=Microbacterium sp. Root61 TaxID=1736570 RepID=UPI000A5B8467|nr:acyl-CoA dehydrogenase family protein [Microbacterium sp. Root61]